jgi:hypothetical protein
MRTEIRTLEVDISDLLGPNVSEAYRTAMRTQETRDANCGNQSQVADRREMPSDSNLAPSNNKEP